MGRDGKVTTQVTTQNSPGRTAPIVYGAAHLLPFRVRAWSRSEKNVGKVREETISGLLERIGRHDQYRNVSVPNVERKQGSQFPFNSARWQNHNSPNRLRIKRG